MFESLSSISFYANTVSQTVVDTGLYTVSSSLYYVSCDNRAKVT